MPFSLGTERSQLQRLQCLGRNRELKGHHGEPALQGLSESQADSLEGLLSEESPELVSKLGLGREKGYGP